MPVWLGAGGFGILGIELGDLDFFCEADLGEEPDAVVVDVELVPCEAVAGADRVSVVIVVPTFATGEDGDPPVVAGIVLGLEAALAPEVGGGVDEPCCMETDGDAKEGSPENHAESTDDRMSRAEKRANDNLEDAGGDQRDVVVLAEPDVDWIAGEIGSVTAEESGFGVHGTSREDPAGVCPPGAVVRRVGVTLVIGVLMMDAVGGYPEDGTALEREAAAHRDEVLDPLWGAIATVGQEAVIGHSDTYVDGEEVHDGEGRQIFP